MATESKPRAKGKYFNKKLKAKEVLRLYEAGERNFQGVILRNQSFKGKHLSGADFSGAYIRSTDFTNATLVGVNFTDVKCGLNKRWAAFLTILSWFLASMSGFISALNAVLVETFFKFDSLEMLYAYNVSMFVSIIFTIVFVFQGSRIAILKGVILIAFAEALIIAIEGELNLYSLGATAVGGLLALFGGLLLVLAGAFVLAGTLVVADAGGGVILGSVFVITGTILGGFVGILSIVITIELFTEFNIFAEFISQIFSVVIGGMVMGTFIIVLPGGYVAWRAMTGKSKDDWVRSYAIAFAAKGGTSFRRANLTDSNFSFAKLKSTDMRKANLTRVRWFKAQMLNRVRPGDTYLKDAQIRQWVVGEEKDKNFDNKDLQGINLQGANLDNASFVDANLTDTDLSGATLTGACILNWNINSHTKLNDVICDYVYLDREERERRPSDPNKTFAPGDFANLVQKSLSTVDLIFSEGIDWQGFLDSFKKLQVEDGNGELVIQAIERKTNGAFVVRVEVPPDADKASIEESFWKKYNPLLEAKDKEIKLLSQQTEFYSHQVEAIRKDNTRLLGIVETMAEKETIKVQQNFNAPVTGVASNIEGNQNIFTSQSISQASTEIQNLLTTLQNNGLTQEQAEGKVAKDLANAAENDSAALGKLVNWGKSLGNKAAETSVSEIARRVIKLALNLAGVPLP